MTLLSSREKLPREFMKGTLAEWDDKSHTVLLLTNDTLNF